MENNTPRKKQLPAFLILGIIALVAAVILAATNAVTKGPIQEHKMAALKEAFNAVMPADSYEEMTVPAEHEVSSLYAAKTGDQVVGYCVTAVGKGYNGDVAVTLGVDTNGMVTGCAVGDTSFAETAGFGARAKEPAFQDQFKGLDAVNGGSFEALSGATITSTAVLNATNAALRCVTMTALSKEPAADPLVTFGKSAAKEGGEEEAPATLTGNVMEGTAKGYDDQEITVSFTLDDAGAISALTVDASSQTPGLGQRCSEAEFTDRFIGKTIPVEGVDALSGATITSNAVIEAINNASAATGAAEGALTATAKGFDDKDITVNVTLDDAGAIATLTVDASSQTPGLGQLCAEEAFTSQFIGKTGPFILGDGIDAVASATITSTAVVEAVNATLAAPVSAPAAEEPATVIAEDENAQLGVKADGSATVKAGESFTGTVDVNLTVENGKVTEGKVASKVPSTAEMTEDGKFTATAKGFDSDVRATLTLNADGTIAELELDTKKETEYLGETVEKNQDFLNQFIGKAAPFTLGDGVDAVSGCTVTSTAAVAAINDAAAFALENAGDAPKAAEAPEAPAAAEALTATAKGFDDKDITVNVTLDDAGAIATLTVDASTQTPGLGQRCAEEEFTSKFIGKTLPVEGIDVLTGATITSNAVIDAVNSLAADKGEAADETNTANDAAEALTATAKGFGDQDITVNVTLDDAGAIAALTVDASTQTPNFGQRCAEEEFTSQFIGKTLPVEGIDVLTGATVTSNAVIEAVNSLAADNGEAADETNTANDAAEALTATAKGFGDQDITVNVTLDDAGAIAALTVDASTQTPNFGQRCAEEEFTSQFIGKTLPVEGIDVLTGATVTSNAVIEAVNSLAADNGDATENNEATDAAAEALTATAKGFGDQDITVNVTLDDAGAIAALTVDASTQTPNFGQRCAEEEFTSQFIGKTLPVEDVDVLTGATVTSNAVIDAVNSLAADNGEAAEDDKPTATATDAAAEAEELTATAKGFGDQNITVNVTLDDAGAIATLTVDASTQTPNFGQRCAEEEFTSQFIGKMLPVEGIDVLTGATITSNAVIEAVNSLGADNGEAANDAAAEALTATAKGFDDKHITVSVTLDDAGAIATLTVDASTQTPNFGQRCAEEEFTSQFIGKKAPFTLGEGIDAVTSATITSTAVVDALNELLGK